MVATLSLREHRQTDPDIQSLAISLTEVRLRADPLIFKMRQQLYYQGHIHVMYTDIYSSLSCSRIASFQQSTLLEGGISSYTAKLYDPSYRVNFTSRNKYSYFSSVPDNIVLYFNSRSITFVFISQLAHKRDSL